MLDSEGRRMSGCPVSSVVGGRWLSFGVCLPFRGVEAMAQISQQGRKIRNGPACIEGVIVGAFYDNVTSKPVHQAGKIFVDIF